ncbi:MAG: hypothetical protein ACX93T_03610 [Bacteroidota bacterium]
MKKSERFYIIGISLSFSVAILSGCGKQHTLEFGCCSKSVTDAVETGHSNAPLQRTVVASSTSTSKQDTERTNATAISPTSSSSLEAAGNNHLNVAGNSVLAGGVEVKLTDSGIEVPLEDSSSTKSLVQSLGQSEGNTETSTTIVSISETSQPRQISGIHEHGTENIITLKLRRRRNTGYFSLRSTDSVDDNSTEEAHLDSARNASKRKNTRTQISNGDYSTKSVPGNFVMKALQKKSASSSNKEILSQQRGAESKSVKSANFVSTFTSGAKNAAIMPPKEGNTTKSLPSGLKINQKTLLPRQRNNAVEQPKSVISLPEATRRKNKKGLQSAKNNRRDGKHTDARSKRSAPLPSLHRNRIGGDASIDSSIPSQDHTSPNALKGRRIIARATEIIENIQDIANGEIMDLSYEVDEKALTGEAPGKHEAGEKSTIVSHASWLRVNKNSKKASEQGVDEGSVDSTPSWFIR